jgi:hypothetical protein
LLIVKEEMPSYPIRIYQEHTPIVFNPPMLQIPGDVELTEPSGNVIQRGRLTTAVEVTYPDGGKVVFNIGSRANLHYTIGVPDYIILFDDDGIDPNYQPPIIGGRRRRRTIRRCHRRRQRTMRHRRR